MQKHLIADMPGKRANVRALREASHKSMPQIMPAVGHSCSLTSLKPSGDILSKCSQQSRNLSWRHGLFASVDGIPIVRSWRIVLAAVLASSTTSPANSGGTKSRMRLKQKATRRKIRPPLRSQSLSRRLAHRHRRTWLLPTFDGMIFYLLLQ